jgi:uncharacterized protein (DUF1697 family)
MPVASWGTATMGTMADVDVVFYRNMNLGHPGSPVRAALEDALTEAGGKDVRSFQTNGTVLFRAVEPRGVVDRAAAALRDVGYTDAGIVRPLDLLRELLQGDPFGGFRDERTYRETFTFYDGGTALPVELPWTSPRDDVDLVTATGGVALGIIRQRGGSVGSPTSEIERMTGGVATTRTLRTIQRLVAAADKAER